MNIPEPSWLTHGPPDPKATDEMRDAWDALSAYCEDFLDERVDRAAKEACVDDEFKAAQDAVEALHNAIIGQADAHGIYL